MTDWPGILREIAHRIEREDQIKLLNAADALEQQERDINRLRKLIHDEINKDMDKTLDEFVADKPKSIMGKEKK